MHFFYCIIRDKYKNINNKKEKRFGKQNKQNNRHPKKR